MSPRLHGVGVSPGIASGPIVKVGRELDEPPEFPPPNDPDVERDRIQPAAEAVAARLNARAANTEGDARTLLETTAAMAVDPALIAEAQKRVAGQRIPAPRAVYLVANGFAEALAAGGEYMAQRARDVYDVRDRIVAELRGVDPPGTPELEKPAVLIAHDLAPADTADLDPELVLALVTEEGGPNSHTAILARSLRIPAVVGCTGVLETEARGITVYGGDGVVELFPEPVRASAAVSGLEAEWDGTAATADGHEVGIYANVGSPSEAAQAIRLGAHGIGLFRTEFCYLHATSEPDTDAQHVAYTEVLTPFANKPVIARTLDAGADKPMPFLRRSAEPNPALGVRGIRLSAVETGMLDRQLAAIAGAAEGSGARVSVMAPMVSTADEARWFADRARSAGLDRVGVMIEVPAAAATAGAILTEVDFVSLGTNDLAQYLFAADRMLGAVAALHDPWQPALLQMIASVCEAARRVDKPVGVCGEAASDAQFARVLVGFGVTSLSVRPSAVPTVGEAITGVTLAECQHLASRHL